MINIKDLKAGDANVTFTCLINRAIVGKTSGANRTNYITLTLQDATGTLDAKLWSATDEQIATFVGGAVVRVTGDVIKYNLDRQMKVAKIAFVSDDENEAIKYVESAPISSDILIQEVEKYIGNIKNNNIFLITSKLFSDNIEKLKIYPAASKNHHEFVSGLIYHTATMLEIAKSLIAIYPQLNSDLLYAGIVLHDLGKIIELSGPIVPEYTTEGRLVGHISITNCMIKSKAEELGIEGEEVYLLQHIILSHHGKQEFGSPVLPQLKEAEIISLIDNIDARMIMMDKALDVVEPGEFTKRIFSLENRSFYKPKI